MQTDIKFRTGTAQGAADHMHIQGQHAAVEQERPGTAQAAVEQSQQRIP
jgi:hypothetical protein